MCSSVSQIVSNLCRGFWAVDRGHQPLPQRIATVTWETKTRKGGLHLFWHLQTQQNDVGSVKPPSHPAASPPLCPAAVCRGQIFLEHLCLWVHLASGFLHWVTTLWHHRPADSPQSGSPSCSRMTSPRCSELWWWPAGEEGRMVWERSDQLGWYLQTIQSLQK